MNYGRTSVVALAALLSTTACVNESYDGVPIDVSYTSTIQPDFQVELPNDQSSVVEAFGIAIGFTRIHHCAADGTAPSVPWVQRWSERLIPLAHAHSPSTPTSSGIPVILSTEAHGTTDRVTAALRPVRGERFCRVEIQLLAADNDAHLLEYLPDIETHASIARIDGEWVGAAAGPSRVFKLESSLVIEDGLHFRVELHNEDFQAAVAALELGSDAPEHLSEQLQDAALNALQVHIEHD